MLERDYNRLLSLGGTLDRHAREIYRFYHVPASNTAMGHMIFENTL